MNRVFDLGCSLLGCCLTLVLLGYNHPSEHKVIFQALFVNNKLDPMQPAWPDTPYADANASALGTCGGSTLKASTIHLRNHLHHVLVMSLG